MWRSSLYSLQPIPIPGHSCTMICTCSTASAAYCNTVVYEKFMGIGEKCKIVADLLTPGVDPA